MHFAKRIQHMKPSEIREIMKLTVDPEIISFAGGMPDPAFFPITALRKISDMVLREDGGNALQYNTTKGYTPLREKIANQMKSVEIRVSAEDILILSGSQQGIDICGKVFLDEGDAIVCESPSYSGAIDAFRAYLPEFVEIPTDDEGMDMRVLEQALAARDNIKLIYVIPDFQNPTGRTWSLERRQKLMELANQFDKPVIEDDPYSSFRFEGSRVPALKSLDTGGRVIYLGTFSKTLCPGLRVGWAAASKEILGKIEIVKQVSDIHSNSLSQREIDRYLETYGLKDQIERITAIYKKRRTFMLDAMAVHFPDGCRWTEPEGGIFIWVEMPEMVDTRRVLLESIKEKVAFIPGGGFFPNSQKANTLRLSYATMPEDKIVEGIKRLGCVLENEIVRV